MTIDEVVLNKEICDVEFVRLSSILIIILRQFSYNYSNLYHQTNISVIINFNKNCQNNDQILYLVDKHHEIQLKLIIYRIIYVLY